MCGCGCVCLSVCRLRPPFLFSLSCRARPNPPPWRTVVVRGWASWTPCNMVSDAGIAWKLRRQPVDAVLHRDKTPLWASLASALLLA